MESQYEIVVNIRVPEGYIEASRYSLVGSKDDALDLFNQLQGEDTPVSSTAIRFDLIQTRDTLPTLLYSRFTTLHEAGDNCKVILREIFKLQTFKI